MRALIAVVLLGLALAQPAAAAMSVRIRVDPAAPRAGERARLSVVTLVPDGARCVDDPVASPIANDTWHISGGATLALELAAIAPSGRAASVKLARRVDDGSRWDADFTFDEPGRWRLEMTSPSWASGPIARCAGAVRELDVTSADASEASFVALMIALGAAAIVAAAASRIRQAIAE